MIPKAENAKDKGRGTLDIEKEVSLQNESAVNNDGVRHTEEETSHMTTADDYEMARVLIDGGAVDEEGIGHTDEEAPRKTATGEQERAEVLKDEGAVVVEVEMGEEEEAYADNPLRHKKRSFDTSYGASIFQELETEDYFKEADDEHDIAKATKSHPPKKPRVAIDNQLRVQFVTGGQITLKTHHIGQLASTSASEDDFRKLQNMEQHVWGTYNINVAVWETRTIWIGIILIMGRADY
jgi:hypothetical protein